MSSQPQETIPARLGTQSAPHPSAQAPRSTVSTRRIAPSQPARSTQTRPCRQLYPKPRLRRASNALAGATSSVSSSSPSSSLSDSSSGSRSASGRARGCAGCGSGSAAGTSSSPRAGAAAACMDAAKPRTLPPQSAMARAVQERYRPVSLGSRRWMRKTRTSRYTQTIHVHRAQWRSRWRVWRSVLQRAQGRKACVCTLHDIRADTGYVVVDDCNASRYLVLHNPTISEDRVGSLQRIQDGQVQLA
ncbi:hypothetical protein C8Q73DRAFT_402465 [Cubamyces lactineus]|nr:hypothetical protein C8Q73DRAFT_402465 [Cubamyces lactineus]